MKQNNRAGLAMLILSTFSALAYRIDEQYIPWYVMMLLVVGTLMLVYGDDS